MNKQDLIELFEMFLNEQGKWLAFKEYIESQGYTLLEIGMEDEE